MSLESRLDKLATVHVRAPETDKWRQTGGAFRCSIEPLSDSARGTMALLDPSTTHIMRCRPRDNIRPGRRVKVATGEEYDIRAVRTRKHPMGGMMVVSLSAMEPAT
jgi:hypothetical protein